MIRNDRLRARVARSCLTSPECTSTQRKRSPGAPEVQPGFATNYSHGLRHQVAPARPSLRGARKPPAKNSTTRGQKRWKKQHIVCQPGWLERRTVVADGRPRLPGGAPPQDTAIGEPRRPPDAVSAPTRRPPQRAPAPAHHDQIAHPSMAATHGTAAYFLLLGRAALSPSPPARSPD
jgi:hypothetical protein